MVDVQEPLRADRSDDRCGFRAAVQDACAAWVVRRLVDLDIFDPAQQKQAGAWLAVLGDLALYVQIHPHPTQWSRPIEDRLRAIGQHPQFADLLFWHPHELEHILGIVCVLEQRGGAPPTVLQTLRAALEYGYLQTVERTPPCQLHVQMLLRQLRCDRGLPPLSPEMFEIRADLAATVALRVHDHCQLYRAFLALELLKHADRAVFEHVRARLGAWSQTLLRVAIRGSDLTSLALMLAACYRAEAHAPALEQAAWRQIQRLWGQMPSEAACDPDDPAFQHQVTPRLALLHATALAEHRSTRP